MISDNELYSLAVFLGSLSMLLIVVYHFLEVNAQDDTSAPLPAPEKGTGAAKEKGGVRSGKGR